MNNILKRSGFTFARFIFPGLIFPGFIFTGMLLTACGNGGSDHQASTHGGHGEPVEVDVIKGPHGGRLLSDGDFTLELAIFETGVPPEFRVWATRDGKAIAPEQLKLNVRLTRLGGKVDDIGFTVHGDALRGDMVIYEPHSFVVSIRAQHQGEVHQWQYDNFEGRTQIEAAVAEALGIETAIAGPRVLRETVRVYGRVVPAAQGISKLSARFPGVVKSVAVAVGDRVSKGQVLATVESNESLNQYHIRAMIAGVITERNVNTGEQTHAGPLFTVIDPSTVWVELALFPAERQRVRIAAPVSITNTANTVNKEASIDSINVTAEANQSVKARVVVDNPQAALLPGDFVTAEIQVGEHAVPLAVKRSGLQAFRDFTVVYAQVEDTYEVRMLDLGRQDGEWIEVLGGLEAGSRYVSDNSYVIKADIEKSGAAHDH